MSLIHPSPFSKTLALVPPVVVLATQSAVAAPTIFIKVEPTLGSPLLGESVEKYHPSWSEGTAVNFGVSNPVTMTTGGLQVGRSLAGELVLTKRLDKSSPALFLACAQGTTNARVTIEISATNTLSGVTSTYYRITLANVVVSKLSSASTGDYPSESVSLTYEKITTEYYMVDSKGNVPSSPTSTSTWNFATNSTK